MNLDWKKPPLLQRQGRTTRWQTLPSVQSQGRQGPPGLRSIPAGPNPSAHCWVQAPATCTAWLGKNSELMAVASTCLECRLQLCLKSPRSAGPGPGPFRVAPTPGDLFMPLDSCSHIKAPVHLLEDFHLGKFYDTW